MLRETSRGIFLDVKATPKASRDEIKGWRDDALLVRVTVAPENGKANDAIIALLAKSARVPKSAFELVSGETNRNKSFRLASHVEHVQAWVEGLKRE
jgi:uncharacterized protein (TIGR00251 family)